MFTRDRRYAFTERNWTLAIVVIALVALTVFVAGRASALAPSNQIDQPQPEASTQPAADGAYEGPDPFPATEGMTDTVQSVLDEYVLANPPRDVVPGVAAPEADLANGPVAVEQYGSAVFLPAVRSVSNLPPVTPTPPRFQPADMSTTLWPAPSIHVARGNTIAYEIRIKNYGAGEAGSHQVTLPYNAQQMTVAGSQFNKTGDWVSSVNNERVVVNFGKFAAGEYRTAKIFFRVHTNLADNTVINMRAFNSWADGRSGGGNLSNWTPLLVGARDVSAAWLWQTGNPLGGYPGTSHRFFSDRFIPGEGIITWLNTPNGTRPLTLKTTADPMGRATLDFVTTGLPRGAYSFVMYGARSNLTGITTFHVW